MIMICALPLAWDRKKSASTIFETCRRSSPRRSRLTTVAQRGRHARTIAANKIKHSCKQRGRRLATEMDRADGFQEQMVDPESTLSAIKAARPSHSHQSPCQFRPWPPTSPSGPLRRRSGRYSIGASRMVTGCGSSMLTEALAVNFPSLVVAVTSRGIPRSRPRTSASESLKTTVIVLGEASRPLTVMVRISRPSGPTNRSLRLGAGNRNREVKRRRVRRGVDHLVGFVI